MVIRFATKTLDAFLFYHLRATYAPHLLDLFVVKSGGHTDHDVSHKIHMKSVDKRNQLDVTFCILYFSSNSCSTFFVQPCAHHQVLTTA